MKFETRQENWWKKTVCVLEPGETDIVIPAEYTTLGEIENRDAIRSAVLPAGTKEIDVGLFENCKKLKEVVLPDGLEVIELNAFSGCTSLQHIDLPDSIRKIGSNAFNGCNKLKEIILPSSLRELGEVFSKCTSLEYVRCSGGTALYSNCVKGCKKLRYIHVTGEVLGADFKYYPQVPIFFDSFEVERLTANMRNWACKGFAIAVADGKTVDPEVEKSNIAYIKKNKAKFLEDAVFCPGMTELLLREGCVNAAWKEKLLSAARERKDEALVKLLGGEAAASGEEAPKAKTKLSKAEIERAERQKAAEAGKGGLVFAIDVDFGYGHWGKEQFQSIAELKNFLTERGMLVSDTVTSKVDYLVIPNKCKTPTAKMKKAVTLGAKTITEAELLNSTWPLVKKDLCSADGKTWTFDANSNFKHEMLLDGTIPDSVETINISAVALMNSTDNSRVRLPTEIREKIQLTDINKIKAADDKQEFATIAYISYTPLTLDLFKKLVPAKNALGVLRDIMRYGVVSPVREDFAISEDNFMALPVTGLYAEIAEFVGGMLMGDDMISLSFAASGNPVPRIQLLTVLLSLVTRCNADGKIAFEVIPSVESRLLGLIRREDLQAMCALYFQVGGAYFSETLVQRIACKLCCAAQAREIVSAYRSRHYAEGAYDIFGHVWWALGCNEDHDVLLYLDKVKLLKWAAEARGMKEDDLRAQLVGSTDTGLDADGSMMLDDGERKIRATLLPDMKFVFVDAENGKQYKNLPKLNEKSPEGKAAVAAYKELREKVKTLGAIYLNKVKEMYSQGVSMTAGKWQALFQSDLLAKRVAQGVLWGVYDKSDRLQQAFVLKEQTAFDSNGSVVKLQKNAHIGVVDMAQLSKEEAEAWRKHFSEAGLVQPIPQVMLPVLLVPTGLVEQRYMDCFIEANMLQSIGWDIFAEEAQDPCVHSSCIHACVDYYSRHGMISGSGRVTEVTVDMKHDIQQMSDHEKRLWNQSVQRLDHYLHPENKAIRDIRLGDEVQVRMWAELGVINAENVSEMLNVAADAGRAEVTGLLLQMKHSWNVEDDDLVL